MKPHAHIVPFSYLLGHQASIVAFDGRGKFIFASPFKTFNDAKKAKKAVDRRLLK